MEPPQEEAPEQDVEDAAGLPPAAAMVELALTPFKKYRQSSLVGGRGAKGGEEVEGDSVRNDFPPVVKINVSLLGFESIGPAEPTPAPPGQRTLREMMWLRHDAVPAAASKVRPEGSPEQRSPEGASRPFVGENAGQVEDATVVPPPVEHVLRSPGSVISTPTTRTVSPSLELEGESRDHAQHVTEGSVLVRCPRCMACLPLGATWDAHREEHSLVSSRREPALRRQQHVPFTTVPPEAKTSPCTPRQDTPVSPQIPRLLSSAESSGAATGTQTPDGRMSVREMGGSRGSTPSNSDAEAGGLADDNAAGGPPKRRLSDLLRLAVSSEQAADVLRQRGFLRADGQTRFARVGLLEERQGSALDE